MSSTIESIVKQAVLNAEKMKHEYVCVEHIALCLLDHEYIIQLCEDLSVDVSKIKSDLSAFLHDSEFNGLVSNNGVKGTPKQTAAVERVFQRCVAQTIFKNKQDVDVADLLISILSEEESFASYFYQLNGLTVESVMESAKQQHTMAEHQEMLTEFTVNLNEEARRSNIDPLIGRHTEVDDLIHILARRKKNNAVLVGEPGTGKTAIVEGLAKKIVEGDVPSSLKNRTIYSLNLGSMLAGTKYRGDFEERVKTLLKALESDPHSVLFIDEIHMIMGAGATGQGNVDAANLLKPVLGRGKLLTIGATTADEWADTIEKDRAMSRRFAKLIIEETDVAATKEIVCGLKHQYEQFHNVEYSTELLHKAVELTDRYVKTRHFPDKALDVIDAAGAAVKLRQEQQVSIKDVIAAIAKISNINHDLIDIEDTGAYVNMEQRIQQKVFGQHEAIEKITESILVSKSGLREPNKPVGSFLLVGPTGTGKTEVARALSEQLQSKLVKFDMSEYMEKHSVSKLIGAPPGYVGHSEGKMGDGQLTAAVKESPNCVLLLDEVEKAAPEVLQVLLQVMDDGKLTGASGNVVDFSNVILLMTSNLGAADAQRRRMGFGDSARTGDIDRAVEAFFAPEFRNRLDAIVQFNALQPEHMEMIVQKLITDTNQLLASNDSSISITVTPDACTRLATDGYERTMGARPLKRLFENEIKKPLSRKILFENIKDSDIEIGHDGEQYTYTQQCRQYANRPPE